MDSHKEYSARPLSAPRCFGLPTAFGADAAICGVCSHHDDCMPLAKNMLTEIAAHMDVGNVGSMHISKKAHKNQPIIAASAVKVVCNKGGKSKMDALIKQILKANSQAGELLSNNVNPFSVSTKPAHLRALTNLIIEGKEDDQLISFLAENFSKNRNEAEKLLSLTKSAFELLITQHKENHDCDIIS